MLNPNLDRQELAYRFDQDGRVRVDDVLEPDVAERIHAACLEDVPFEFIYHLDGEHKVTSSAAMAAFDTARQQEIQDKVMEAASSGVGFLYCGYMIRRKHADTGNENLRFLNRMFEYMNGDEMLSFASEVCGRDDLRSADAQFTRYTPGQFLTRHRDDETADQRRIAYVMSFSKDWHPDWGGLLQFYSDDGTPRDAWSPKFNTLSLFEIRHVHAVTYVAPYAQAPRLSLTGWFRSEPPDFS